MARPLTPDVLAASKEPTGHLVHFIEFATFAVVSAPTAELVRTQEGLLGEDLFDRADSSSLGADWSDPGGAGQILSNRLRLTPQTIEGTCGCDGGVNFLRDFLTYTKVAARGQMLVQLSGIRPTNDTSARIAAYLKGASEDAWGGMGEASADCCATTLDQRLFMRQTDNAKTTVVDPFPNQGVSYPLSGTDIPVVIHKRPGGPTLEEIRWMLNGVGTGWLPVGPLLGAVQGGVAVEMSLCCGSGPVDVENFRVMRDNTVTVVGLPSGWGFSLQRDVADEYDNIWLLNTPTAWENGAGVATLALIPGAWPYRRLTIGPPSFDPNDFLLVEPSGSANRDSSGGSAAPDIWGGDVYAFGSESQGLDVPLVNITDAPMDLLWDGKTWVGVGGMIAFDRIVESIDERSQRVNLALPVVDLATVVRQLKDTKHRGGVVRIWQAHYDQATGLPLSEPTLVFRGFTQGGFEVEESRGENEGTAVIKASVASRLAEFEKIRGIQTNVNIHQRFFPGDTFFQNVPHLIGKDIEWGRG